MRYWYSPLLLWVICQPLMAHQPISSSQQIELTAKQITEKVYVAHGPQAFPNPQTAGFMNNPAFIVTSAGVVVIDPGSSVQIGRKLLRVIARVTDQPIVAVFNTHVHGDHWLGNQAIQEAYPQVTIYAHQRMREHIAAGAGETWVALFKQLTEGATDGTQIVAPNTGLQGGEHIQIGATKLVIHHTGKAHSDNDIMIEVPDQSVLFTGDILANQRIQSARPQDSNIYGQIRAVEHALGTPSQWFVPGHGHTGQRRIAEQQRVFLNSLLAAVERYYEQGLSDFEMVDAVKQQLSEYQHWHNFNELGRVISYVYLNVEENAFE